MTTGATIRRTGVAAELERLVAVAGALVLAESLHELADLIEAAGEYYYDVENVKRWVLGPGGKAGNCETCIENADEGWIADDGVFLDSSGNDIDGPEAHPHCTCTIEYREKRVRVYA